MRPVVDLAYKYWNYLPVDVDSALRSTHLMDLNSTNQID